MATLQPLHARINTLSASLKVDKETSLFLNLKKTGADLAADLLDPEKADHIHRCLGASWDRHCQKAGVARDGMTVLCALAIANNREAIEAAIVLKAIRKALKFTASILAAHQAAIDEANRAVVA